MNDEKKELKVAALENGTVIDHIPSSQLFKVVSILGLENCTNSITIGNNLASKKIGKSAPVLFSPLYIHPYHTKPACSDTGK